MGVFVELDWRAPLVGPALVAAPLIVTTHVTKRHGDQRRPTTDLLTFPSFSFLVLVLLVVIPARKSSGP
jgi:hypothetical protein